MSIKLGLFLEVDDKGKETGRFQAADDTEDPEDSLVWETFNTEEEAQSYIDKMNAQFERDEKIEGEYREWEKSIINKYGIALDDLRVLLANGVVGEEVKE